MKQLKLDYTPRSHYEVPIFLGRGAVALLPALLRDLHCDSVHVIVDASVYAVLQGSAICHLLREYPTLLQPPGEAHKTLDSVERLCTGFFQQGGTNNSCIVALGGGVTGNVAGLVASLVYRGVHLVHVPTTLVGQLDSAIDVKQSANLFVKNAVGTYYPPSAVVVDPELLEALPVREVRSGLAEAIKHGLAQDMRLTDLVMSWDFTDLDHLQEIISTTIELKLTHYHETRTKWQDRVPAKLLTHVGHSVGKVVEALSMGELSHGEAVSHGMVAEGVLSSNVGLLAPADLEAVKSILQHLELLPVLPAPCTVEAIIGRLLREQKQPTFALLAALGKTQVVSGPVPVRTIVHALEQWMAGVR